MSTGSKPTIGITFGDPCGIGPEIIAKALRQPSIQGLAEFLVIGDARIFRQYQRSALAQTTFLDLKNIPGGKIALGRVSRQGGQASLEYLDTALSLLAAKKISALVTAPVCKESVKLVRKDFQGHTEYLAEFFQVKNFDMMFVTKALKVVVATRHIPLAEVPHRLTSRSLCETIILTGDSLRRFFKIQNPRIGICGLNPHAGENGRIGKEEGLIIGPAITKARQRYSGVCGPYAADTIFCPVHRNDFDAVIALYHDQGLIPVKATTFYELVNFTIGLPVIRTSPAHGTAFDIVGKNTADPSSMIEAIRLAVALAKK